MSMPRPIRGFTDSALDAFQFLTSHYGFRCVHQSLGRFRKPGGEIASRYLGMGTFEDDNVEIQIEYDNVQHLDVLFKTGHPDAAEGKNVCSVYDILKFKNLNAAETSTQLSAVDFAELGVCVNRLSVWTANHAVEFLQGDLEAYRKVGEFMDESAERFSNNESMAEILIQASAAMEE